MELLIYEGASYSTEVLEAARVAGWRLRPVPAEVQRQGQLATKLLLWGMHEFHEVVFMPLTSMFIRPLTGPFTSQAAYPNGQRCKIWAGRKFSGVGWQQAPDSNMFAVQPQPGHYKYLQSLATDDKDEETFFNTTLLAHESWCELELEKSANAAAYVHQREAWLAAQQLQVVFFTNSTPWQCKPGLEPICALWQQEAMSDTWPVTIVTAYYVGPSKHGEAKYAAWGRNFMIQTVPMVIFAEKASSIPGLELRDPNMTRVVECSVDEFLVSQHLFNDRWEQQLQLDPERSIHNIFLFKVWMEKTNFAMKAIEMNPFGSSYYVWMDFGGFRVPDVWGKGWVPHAERFPTRNRILLLNAPASHPTKHIGGGFFGGTVRAWDVWSRIFFTRLSLELRRGIRFVGDDQILMSLLAHDHPRAVCRLSATPIQDDVWFYMQHYLAGKTPINVSCTEHSPLKLRDHGKRNLPSLI